VTNRQGSIALVYAVCHEDIVEFQALFFPRKVQGFGSWSQFIAGLLNVPENYQPNSSVHSEVEEDKDIEAIHGTPSCNRNNRKTCSHVRNVKPAICKFVVARTHKY